MSGEQNGSTEIVHDVVIIGGGPVGSTTSTLLKRYRPELDVVVVEKERFPRDHVGESQLPSIGPVLEEMGVWEKVEAAGFPIKIGASYTWGHDLERWDFDFYPVEHWQDEPRPAKFEGQRRSTAFQVDRAVYDTILLDHAASVGVDVRQETRITEVLMEGDRVDGLRLADGSILRGRYYVDGSGAPAILRRAAGVESDAPQELRNIAIWDYWENAEWAVEIGVGTTRVQVRSLPYGWIWFIPLGPTRTSVGLITPNEHYKKMGLPPETLYLKALEDQKEIAKLVRKATRRGKIESCKDWSHLAHRLVGENWFLAGEAAGFADPILAAGMSLAHSSSRDVAYTILELERGELDAAWLRARYDERNRTNIRQHIRFAQYWYSANGCFTDLQDHCASIAQEAGLRLSPQRAWQWLSQGGFSTESQNVATAGSFDVASTKQILERFDNRQRELPWLCDGYNVFKLNLRGAETEPFGVLEDGQILQVERYVRGDRTLPLTGIYRRLVDILYATSDGATIVDRIHQRLGKVSPSERRAAFGRYLQALEVLIEGRWVTRKRDKKRPMINVSNEGQRYIRSATEVDEALADAGRSDLVRWNVEDERRPDTEAPCPEVFVRGSAPRKQPTGS